jgi:Abortive infection alpha
LSDDLKSLIDVAAVSEVALERTEKFLGKLLGSAVLEAGELVTDKIRFWRFKNQVKILQRAENILKKAGRDPGRVSLKTLVPLIEQASLEEEPTIQEMWAKLIAKASQSSAKAGLHVLCIEVLGSISSKEAEIISYIWADYQQRHPELLKSLRKYDQNRVDIYAESLYYRPHNLYIKIEVSSEDGDFLLDNLMRLNILRYEVPPVRDGETEFPEHVHLTELGLAVLKECLAPLQ